MGRNSLAVALAITLLASAAQIAPAGAEGTWEGTLTAGQGKLRLIVDISKAADGLYVGSLNSVDQGAKMPIDTIQVTGDTVRFELKPISGTFEGSLNADKTQLKGTWTQLGRPLPLELTRAAKPAAVAKLAEPAKPPAGAGARFELPLELHVPIAPTPFAGGGKTHLVYELHITNFSGSELLLKRIDILGDNVPPTSFEGAELNALLARPGTSDLADKRSVAAGLRAVAYVWITLDASAKVPASLHHRITVDDQMLEGGTVMVSTAKPVVIGSPLRGSDWVALNGPSNTSAHRRALIPVGGKASIAQRFAIDWAQVGTNGRTFTDDAKDNKNYRAYGNEVLAVADAVVAAIKDGIPENIPGLNSRAVPITLETIGGNHIILDLGGGRFAFYAHLQPGSLRVKVGERVRRGQVLALLGNSGNSTEPHLHFHVSDGNSPLSSEGLPHALESFEVLKDDGSADLQKNQLPLQNARIRFSK
jgi:hypothetical protein